MIVNKIVRHIGVILIAWMSLTASAQTGSFLEFSAGGGWSTLTYSLKNAPSTIQTSQSGSYGLHFHAGYGYLIVPSFGIGIGVDVSRFGAEANMSGEMRWKGVTDTDGEKYNHVAQLNRWHERQEIYYVEVPLTFYVFIPTSSELKVSLELGAKYAFPFRSDDSYQANVTHFGEYPLWGLTLRDMPNHGFSTVDLTGKGRLEPKGQLMAFAKIGVSYPLAPNIYFFTNAYATYGLLKTDRTQEGTAFGLRQDTQKAREMHYFIPPAVSVIQTNLPSGSFLPVSAGLEIGIRFFFPPKKKYPCRCLLRT